MKNCILKLRIFLWLILAGVVVWLLYMGVVPSGKISYVYDFKETLQHSSGQDYFIGKLTPKERINEGEKSFSRMIIGDPVYFSLRTPRRFNKAKLILKYKNNNNLPIIEAGVLVDKTIWRYDLQPIENKIIDDLTMAWDVMRENEIILLQRDASTSSAQVKYNSIDEFLNNLPARNEIALYNYPLRQKQSEASDLNTEFLLDDYEPHNVEVQDFVSMQNIASLRGPYQFYTYIKDENFDFTFVFQDLNKNKDSDPIDLYLYYDNKLIDSRHLDDDDITSPQPSPSKGEGEHEKNLELKLANLPEGVYKIELRVNDDIVTKSITTKQQKIAFINKLWLADSGGSDINLFTDSKLINAQTVNPGSLQTVRAGESKLKIEQTYKQFSVVVSSGTTKLILEKDDIIIAGNGVFSFNQDSLINPDFKKVDSYLDIDNNGINYVLANYEIPQEIDGWKTASAEFDLTNAYREDGPRLFGGVNKYSFLISIPGLKADDDIDDLVEISGIRVELEGTTLWEKIRDLVISNK